MGCQKSFTLAGSTTDMPLEQAVYSASVDAIFGIRGQWLYRYNATTGALVDSGRFTHETLFGSSICELNGILYIGILHPQFGNGLAGDYSVVDILFVNPATFPTAASTGLGNWIYSAESWPADWPLGWPTLATDGTKIFGWSMKEGAFSFLPANPTGTLDRITIGEQVWDLCYDPINSVFWMGDSVGGNTWVFEPDLSDESHDSPPYDIQAFGVSYCTLNNKLYSVNGTQQILKHNCIEAFSTPPFLSNYTHVAYNTGRINATPRRIKVCNYPATNPFSDKVLIPAWKDDTVLVWNPATNNVADMVVKSGFTAPIDIVFTPTQAFAVQNAPVGLKLIT